MRDRLSPHQVGVADVLDAARLMDCYPASVTLLGLEPDTIELSVVRSSAVEAGLDGLVETIVREVQRPGYPMRPETGSAERDYPIRDITRRFGM